MGLAFVSIQPVCLLIGTFNPFTLKLIIDIYVPIFIFLIVWGWFCRSFFFSCISWLYKVPLAFVLKLVWWYWILLTFASRKTFWFLHQFGMRCLLGTVMLVVGFSPLVVWIYPAIPFWPAEFLLKDQLLNIWSFPCMLFVAFPLLHLVFFICV